MDDVDNALKAKEAAVKKAEEEKAAEAKAKQEQAERQKLENSIATGWDKSDVKSQENLEKAVRIVSEHTNYIKQKNPEWVITMYSKNVITTSNLSSPASLAE